ncbi:glucosamine-6-phosphate deaminase [Acetobacter orleanensis]|uniref:Glucosamine-6-phosphate deaminase n=1 Tax=Acetobacter orleanensis TaxID=104099 RepID=A0A4Y3TRG8_9PROT|nr:glucosamine-6-phosphate deaminase [Acetobacter orleanensis]KXV66236.1 glucosamine-6-phosphate deaminase [Acetobacter orleanensis]PCD78583.1 glucosamine-6-phosphate deaminase [Acetobacter orleanensis]GAN69889.1 glucosamine-6-phosphate isomerase [Acetobacter orleanensis JCM 7639]GBR31034.1 6-phosphogluconolactonase [Acetobacter orleanensis NRIC 0473]GEB83677.1 glucosamine-6-phosphate deaminase [Acetobacter orleanensis]
MKIVICSDAAQTRRLAAQVLAQQVRSKPNSVLGLATGRTMEAIYAQLAEKAQNEALDFSDVTTFNLDEYIGLAANHPQSYRYYMQEHLFGLINISAENTHVPDGTAEDVKAEARSYENRIAQAGGIDLQLLGLGENGHIGFNEPLSALNSRTHVVTLAQATLRQNAGMFNNDMEQVPTRALTMGTGTILDAREALLVVTDAKKAEIIARVIEGPVSALVPGSALQLHPHCLVLLDAAAASRLTQREAIFWQMQHDPDLRALLSA